MSFWIGLLLYMVYLFLGAYWIWSAIHSFKERRYFWFGFEVVSGIYVVLCLAKLALGI